MRIIIGLLMILGGIVLGLYVGLWVCFIGGIVDIINEIKSPDPVSSLACAWAITKICLASFLGWGIAILMILPGGAMIASD